MGLMKKFFSQTRKSEGTLGKMMLSGMNSGHAKLADWGLEHLPSLSPKSAHHPSKPWITVIAKK